MNTSSTSNMPSGPSLKFAQMTIGGKIVFLAKLIVFFATFGFAFPLLVSD